MRRALRLLVPISAATAVVAGAFTTLGEHNRVGDLESRASAAHLARVASESQVTHALGPGGHRHDDPATKNSVSRGGEKSADTVDPTTPEQARANTTYVATQRTLRRPRLTRVPLRSPRLKHPEHRYAMAGGCYVLRAADSSATFRFQATELGTYLLYDGNRAFLTAEPGAGTTRRAAQPSRAAEWTVTRASRGFRFTNQPGMRLATRGGRLVTTPRGDAFRLTRTRGCRTYPEVAVNVRGNPHGGVSAHQEVRGYVDSHTHGMAFEFLGGGAHCGRPWHKYGAAFALVDCPDHTVTGGFGGALESVLSGRPHHDPVGWPTFKDWPAPDSLTHEGAYYKWLERSWRGGLRLFTNLLVENNQLCQLYPIKKNSCDDMDSVRLQARDMYALQDYIDAQYGGPGKGWYRIVTDPWQARKVINAGKLAVIMGIETSIPFGCTMKLDLPACSAAQIDRQLAEVRKLGVRQMQLVNKFDNALSGVAGDEGAVGVAVNSANFLETGSYWAMQHCRPQDPVRHDKTQVSPLGSGAPIPAQQQDALFGAIASLKLPAIQPAPLYGPPLHCNARGLTDLGAHLVTRLAQNRMVFDPDHMSVKGRDGALRLTEAMGYGGVLSSHSWSTEDAYPRIYRAGGFITPYAGDSTGFVAKWRKHLGWADRRFYFGIGFGADINGLGAQGDPRGVGVPNPVRYPFTGINGIRIDQQVSGRRVYDINADGVAHYGLYPDWIEDLRQVAGADGAAIVDDMERGAEGYLQMWERAEGIRADSCRNPGNRLLVGRFRALARTGMSVPALERAVGMPFQRLGREFTYCARTPDRSRVKLTVNLTKAGRVARVTRK